jgi:ureidoglycolate hydrolase
MAALTLNAVPLDAASRHSRLHLLSIPASKKASNKGLSEAEIVPSIDKCSSAPSGIPGKHTINDNFLIPKPTTSTANGQLLELAFLERHPFSTQTFIPVGGSDRVSFIALAADSDSTGTKPDLSTIRAYTVKGNQGICYDVGLWHAPMTVVGEVSYTVVSKRVTNTDSPQTLEMVMLQYKNAVPAEDCELFYLDGPIHVNFTP